jgi:serine/threonine protein kinase
MVTMKHPNLIRLVGLTVTPPFCIVTEFLPNGSLADLIHRTGISPLRAMQAATEIARAMEYLHACNVLHRDLKPGNVLIDQDGRAIVCDFGLSRTASEVMTAETGTPHWMAPELFATRGQPTASYDCKADVFSFGVILYELVKQRVPFDDCHILQAGARVLKGERASLDGLPDGVKSLISRCWEQKPANRPSMRQVVMDLEGEAFMVSGTNALEFRQWAKRTALEHRAAMQASGLLTQ